MEVAKTSCDRELGVPERMAPGQAMNGGDLNMGLCAKRFDFIPVNP